ncbi:hypothetical protein ACFL7D_02625 [candidate division KSB1 bacterium]
MAEQEEKSLKEGQAIQTFRNELLEGNFDGARVIEREQMIPPQAVQSVVHSTFETFITESKFIKAIEIGKKYEMSKDKIADVIYMEFRDKIARGNFDKAIEWALVYSLPDYEITRAAIKAIEAAILNKDIKLAVEIKQKYNITEEQIGNIWQKGYDDAFKEGKFFEAALLSREFGMSERKTIITSAKAFRNAMNKNSFEGMISVETEFHLFNDAEFSLLGDEESRALIKKIEEYLKEKLRSDSFKKAVELIIGIAILFKEIKNHTLKGLLHFVYSQAIDMHQLLLHDNRYDDAIWFVRELNLLEDNTPPNILREIFNHGVAYHNKLVENGNISQAITIKQDYDLLGARSNADSIDKIQDAIIIVLGGLIAKGETNIANQIINEYSVAPDEVADVTNKAVIGLLRDREYEKSIKIVTRFKTDISNFEIRNAAKEAFEQCFEDGYFETAANLGYIFEVESPNLKEAAKVVWEDLMQRQEYKKAIVIKKKHKLTKRHTESIAKAEYDRLIQINSIDDAQILRSEYRVNVGIFAWFIEVIRKILHLIFKKDILGTPVIDEVSTENESPPEKETTAENNTPELVNAENGA